MALPKGLRLKGHRAFNYLHKNPLRHYHGKLMTFKIAHTSPRILLSHKNNYLIDNFKLAITVSKKVSKKSVIRNKIRRLMHRYFLELYKKSNTHNPYWVIVNLKGGNFNNYENELLAEFHYLIKKSGLIK